MPRRPRADSLLLITPTKRPFLYFGVYGRYTMTGLERRAITPGVFDVTGH